MKINAVRAMLIVSLAIILLYILGFGIASIGVFIATRENK